MFIDENEASRLTGIPVRTLQTWRLRPPHGGGPAFYRIARRIKYDRDELIGWVRKGRATSTTEADVADRRRQREDQVSAT
jgi:hypothetical protein